MVARCEHCCDLALGPTGAHREAVAHRLGHRDHIRHHAGVLEPEPLAGAAVAGLHLVHDQQQSALVAQSAHIAQVLHVGGHHTTLTLHRFEQHRTHRRVDRALQRGDVVERRIPEPIRHRLERFVLGGLTRGCECGQRTSVEAAVGADHSVTATAAELAGQLQRCLVGLGTAVAEEHLAVMPSRLQKERVHLHRGFQRCRVGEQVADVQQLVRLTTDRLGHHRVRMTKRRDREATQEVEIPLAVGVPQFGARAALEHHLRWPEHGHERAVLHTVRVEGVSAHETIVPMPSSVKTSNSSTCGMRPSRM
ncbi:unannotated protein [freshwater metagenome]|uniref:Unannotated protein n=1 Tax=freshwater metagenome TaxID=449393 RepID=A0A6J7C5P8_9ZZZZ